MTVLALLLAAQAANVPELPKDVPANAVRYSVLRMSHPAGQQAVWTEGGARRVFFQFNDRGRGPKIYSSVTLQGDLPVAEQIDGNDYFKDAVHETFSWKDGEASWKSKAEQGQRKLERPAFYVSFYGPPLDFALLARALLSHGGRLPLLPEGEARIEQAGELGKLRLYAVSGIDFEPDFIWLDENSDYFGDGGIWHFTVREGAEAMVPELIRAQREAEQKRWRGQAQRLMHRPAGKLVIHDVTVFEAESAALVPHQDVLVEGNRIVSVLPSRAAPAGATVIDGRGKTLLPGLWDMHAHVFTGNGLRNLASGVTTVRDLANDNDELLARIVRIEKAEEIGTRIVRAGFIDGPGPYQGPTKVLAATPEEILKWVDWYADHGFVQIKLYSSLKPELVPVAAEEAHRRGLRVSGHVPSGMIASQAVEQGYDEIQHVSFLLLNFMPDVTETRTPARFTEPAKRAADLDLASPQVRGFIQLLKDRHITLDPTLSIFESFMLDRPGVVSRGMAAVAARLPVQVRRGLYAGALPVPPGMEERYQASWKKTLQLVHELWAAGIPIEAGTDNWAGFALHRELELDAQAGIPDRLVLQLATLGAARIMGMEKDLGLVRPGKLADLALIDGDPTRDVSEVRKVALTIRDGVIYQPDELDRELGIQPR